MAATAYEQAHAKYRELAKASAGGDKKAQAEKAAVMNDIRAIEREAARAGTRLAAIHKGDKIIVESTECRSKRSLQEAYVDKFASKDGSREPEVKGLEWEGKPVKTLREYHSRRLLGK